MKELTTKEAAEELQVSLRWVQALIRDGRLPAVKRGRDYFIRPEDLKLVRGLKKTGRPPKQARAGKSSR